MGKYYVYVVFKGRKKSVFSSWPECHEQIDGFPGASYKKFNSADEAYKMISSPSIHPSHSLPQSSVNVAEKGYVGMLNSINFFYIFSTSL
ncbi:hypothetical protein Ddye_028519 [Dipteronia dyeriana]|uniref:Ribonuclease H n=1 Tax=Dipteronia dyeriana TaxID=168575 RepID=A0AAD9TCU7_9ROSI|nr:hypothetical protein Ddye_028519 [Dipteronia dyeriana]